MNRQQVLTHYQQRIDQDDRSKLTTEERAFLVQDFIEQLQSLEDAAAIEQLCRDEIELLERGYGKGTNSTINYLSKYRTAIAQATEQGKLPMTEDTSYAFSGRNARTGESIQSLNHLAFDLMRYDNSVYLANRKATNVGNNERQDNPQPFDPDRYLAKATELLQADEPETLAIGIAAVTGRRHTEVAVSGQFELTKHPYVLTFDGQLKKDQPVAYTIATLLPAKEVMQAIDRFRSMPQVQAMQGLTSEEQTVKNFRARVNTRVKQHFQKTEILPLLPGFQSVSVHRLRGAYARLIIHYWLPNQGANEQRFLQFYLGHVEASEMRDAFNSGSTTHYFGYWLKKDGKPITASGIKLMGNPPLPTPTAQQIQQQQQANEQLETTNSDELTTPDTKEDTMPPTSVTVETIAHSLEDLPSKTQEPARSVEPQTSTPAQHPTRARASKPRFKDLAVNVNNLVAVAKKLGLELPKNKGYQALLQQVLQTVLESGVNQSIVQGDALTQAVASLLPEAIAPLVQRIDQLEARLQDAQVSGEPLRLLTEEVEALSQQLQTVQLERDQLTSECEQLRAQLQQAQEVISQFRRIALGAVATGLPATQMPQRDAIETPRTETTAAATHQTGSSVQIQTAPIPSPQSAEPTAPAPTCQKPQRQSLARSGKLSPDKRIAIAIDALMQHNQQCTDPKDRWFISNQTIADMTGTNNFTKVKPWMKLHPEVAEKVQQHNERMETTQPHHNRGKEKEELRQIFEVFVRSGT
jgi:Telomere resolvase